MKKLFFLVIFLGLCSFHLLSVELGIFGGKVFSPSEFSYGLSGSVGLFVPLLKMEAEYSQSPDSDLMAVSASAKIRPKFKKLAPFVLAGVGVSFEKISFDFDQYQFFTLIGGGLHYFFNGFFSLRLDIRFQNFSDESRIRFGLGIFFHL